jgi:methyl farnesoate epoxidase/farnesoate epoxidase
VAGLIFAATPELWMEMRKFSQRTLRDFGFGKRYSMQSVIELEICDIVQEIKEEIKKTDGVLRVRTNFLLSVLNVLWCMIAGQRYAHDDPKLVKMLEKNFAMTKAQTFFDPHVIMTPFLRKIFPTFFKYDLVNKVFEESHEFSRVRYCNHDAYCQNTAKSRHFIFPVIHLIYRV